MRPFSLSAASARRQPSTLNLLAFKPETYHRLPD
jgi:hypothetical protein